MFQTFTFFRKCVFDILNNLIHIIFLFFIFFKKQYLIEKQKRRQKIFSIFILGQISSFPLPHFVAEFSYEAREDQARTQRIEDELVDYPRELHMVRRNLANL